MDHGKKLPRPQKELLFPATPERYLLSRVREGRRGNTRRAEELQTQGGDITPTDGCGPAALTAMP